MGIGAAVTAPFILQSQFATTSKKTLKDKNTGDNLNSPRMGDRLIFRDGTEYIVTSDNSAYPINWTDRNQKKDLTQGVKHIKK